MLNRKAENDVVIVAAKRTPVGSFLGQFAHIRAPILAAHVIEHLISQTHFPSHNIDELILGCVLTAGVGQAPARQALLSAKLPQSIPCSSINKVCGSGMKAITNAYDSILCQHNKAVLTGGMESMSQAPYLMRVRGKGFKAGHLKIIDHLYYDGLENYYDGQLMGYFAELLAESITEDDSAKQFSFNREEQDAYAIESVRRAQAATNNGDFNNEIISIDGVRYDEQVMKADIDAIPYFKPVFKQSHSDSSGEATAEGTITAANASSISDGAAMVLLMSREMAEKHKQSILATIRGYSSHAIAPEAFTIASHGAIEKLLHQLNWSINEVDLFEINEAFAITVLAAMKSLNLEHSKVNIRGGACAIGHPIGASGCRILVTLVHALQATGARKGIASVCIGGGEAMAIALEVEN